MADDGMNEEERVAYEAARRLIAQVKRKKEIEISFDADRFRTLTRIPKEISRLEWLERIFFRNCRISDLTPISGLNGIRELYLDQTLVSDLKPLSGFKRLEKLSLEQTIVRDLSPISHLSELFSLSLFETIVSNLTPIAGLSGLQWLSLSKSGVIDLSPISGLTNLQWLFLNQTSVRDLRPLIALKILGENIFGGIWFNDTSAVRLDETLALLVQIENDKQRTKETLAYLKTLPPWPEPLPWLEETAPPAKPAKPPRKTPPRPSIRTPQKQIAFLLETASITTMQAADLAKGIRLALANVSVLPGTNRLPDALQSMLDLAQVLDRLGTTNLDPAAPDRETQLKARIAELEQALATLTATLADETKAKEAAEARANALESDKGFWANYKTASGKALGYGQIAIAGTAIPVGLAFYLGRSHPMVQTLLELLTK